MSRVIIAIGNIGTGKTTHLKDFFFKKFKIVSRDAIRYMLGGGQYLFRQELEPTVNEINQSAFTILLKRGHNIIVDETNIDRFTRLFYIEQAKNFNYELVALEFPRLDKETAVNRRMENPHDTYNKEIWEMVWDKFESRYEEPSHQEGFDVIVKLEKCEVGIHEAQ